MLSNINIVKFEYGKKSAFLYFYILNNVINYLKTNNLKLHP